MDLRKTYIHLTDGADANPVQVDPEFWAKIGERTELHDGRLVCQFRMEKDWDHWERHPAGDEIVILCSGRVDLVLEMPDGKKTVELTAGKAVIIPKGIWHTGRVHEPGELIGITRGAGTEHRPG